LQQLPAILFSFIFLHYLSPVNTAGQYKDQKKAAIAWTASWSYDDKFIAVGNDNGQLTIYETTHWKAVKSWNYTATTITRVEWNPKYPVLAVTASSHQKAVPIVQLYDMTAGKILLTLPDSIRGRGVSWSPDGENVAFVGSKGRITIFNRQGAWKRSLSFQNPGSLFDIDWHPTKNLLLAVEEDIHVIDIDADTLVATYEDSSKNKGILCCQWHPSGAFFVTGDYGHENEGGQPSYLKYWSAAGKLLRSIKESKFEYRNIKWNAAGKYLVAATDVLLVFDEKGNLISKTKFDDNNLWGAEWSHTGDKIISTDQQGNTRVTDVNGKIIQSFQHQ
jgi:WD40 repeat protein